MAFQSAGGGGGGGGGTVIQTASGPMLVLPDGRVVPFRGGAIPGVNGAMGISGGIVPNAGVVMPAPVIGGGRG